MAKLFGYRTKTIRTTLIEWDFSPAASNALIPLSHFADIISSHRATSKRLVRFHAPPISESRSVYTHVSQIPDKRVVDPVTRPPRDKIKDRTRFFGGTTSDIENSTRRRGDRHRMRRHARRCRQGKGTQASRPSQGPYRQRLEEVQGALQVPQGWQMPRRSRQESEELTPSLDAAQHRLARGTRVGSPIKQRTGRRGPHATLRSLDEMTEDIPLNGLKDVNPKISSAITFFGHSDRFLAAGITAAPPLRHSHLQLRPRLLMLSGFELR